MNIKSVGLVAAFVTSMALGGTALAMDVDTYVDLCKQITSKVKKGKVKDVDKLIAQSEELVRIAIEGALKYVEEENIQNRKVLHLAILNSERMKHMSLEEIEAKWHGGGYLKDYGIDINDYTQIDMVMNYYDTIVHPATAVIALNEYVKTKNPELLSQTDDELTEVIEHAGRIKEGAKPSKK